MSLIYAMTMDHAQFRTVRSSKDKKLSKEYSRLKLDNLKRTRILPTPLVQYSTRFFLFFFVLGLIIICESEFSSNSFSYTKIKSNDD